MENAKPRELTSGDLEALVRLLADEDEKIRRVAREHLTAGGDRALEIVEERALGSDDPDVRRAAGDFLRESRRSVVLAQWRAFAGSREVDLELGAVLIARSEYPDLDMTPHIRTLDGYAAVLRQRLKAIRSREAIIEKISELLFKEMRYRGNEREYYDPRNSYLNHVMDRKLGIPISLSALFLFLARRLDQQVEGVGMPGHFLLRYRQGRKSTFLDPFNRGRHWTYQNCVAYLQTQGFSFREEYLRTIDDRGILLRMLENLLRIYHSEEDLERVNRMNCMLADLRAGM